MTTNFLATLTITAFVWTGDKCANNHWPVPGRTVAVPRSYIAPGTLLLIEGIGLRRADDKLNTRFETNNDFRVDIYMGRGAAAKRRAKRFGIQQRKVWVVKP